MKNLNKQNLTKKIIYIITFLMLCNFIIPNYTYAVDDDDGGDLFVDLAKLICFVPDAVIDFLQYMFISTQPIFNEDGEYKILYSPGTIFAGEIPAFDINFITSNAKELTIVAKYDSYVENVLANNLENAVSTDSTSYLNAQQHSNAQYIDQVGTYGRDYACYWVDEESGKIYIECCYAYPTGSAGYLGANIGKRYYSSFAFTDDDEVRAAYQEVTVEAKYQSTAAILKSTIATWYNALRKIALVGLLSVLVYIGIRIILSSTSAKDKAKYKSMLKDWLVALCILFTLHYIMNITVTVVEKINEVIRASTIGPKGEDVLMTTIRNQIFNGNNFDDVIVEVILYCVLGVYTVIFTIQYLRRTIYIAFLTMIAPLITLTYPLDKIKDSKSQAFDMWVKDYVFFSLLQVVHLLIYYILVGSSIDLTNDGNWVFAIVAIGCLTKAEKLMKKMFGFEKSKSMGALAAGATGALVMNAINKIKAPSKNGKKDSSGGGSNNNVRTASKDPLTALKVNGGQENDGVGRTGGLQQTPTKTEGDTWGGVKSLVGRYHRKVIGAGAGVFLGGTGAIVGLAAGISQGDLGAAAAGAIAGGKAGYGLGQRGVNAVSNLGGNIRNTIDNIGDTWREGAYGEEYASNVKFDREFRRSSTYKSLKQKYGDNFSDTDIQAMLDAGITDKGAMDKILSSGGDIEKEIGYYALSQLCGDDIYYGNDANFKKWLGEKGFKGINDLDNIKDKMRAYR